MLVNENLLDLVAKKYLINFFKTTIDLSFNVFGYIKITRKTKKKQEYKDYFARNISHVLGKNMTMFF